METYMYYLYTLNEHLPLSMCPFPFLSSQGFWELSITHTGSIGKYVPCEMDFGIPRNS